MNQEYEDLVQVRNPKTGKYILIDRAKGVILEHKETKGPYKDVPIAKPKRWRNK